MGREIRRVPLNFNWPLNKVWQGFINPYVERCPTCDGCGVSEDGKRLEDFFRRFALAAEASVERPEDYSSVQHKKSPTFAEALDYVRRHAPRGAGNGGRQQGDPGNGHEVRDLRRCVLRRRSGHEPGPRSGR